MKRSVITINDNLGTIALGFSKAGYDVRAICIDSSDKINWEVCTDNWGSVVWDMDLESLRINDGLDLSNIDCLAGRLRIGVNGRRGCKDSVRIHQYDREISMVLNALNGIHPKCFLFQCTRAIRENDIILGLCEKIEAMGYAVEIKKVDTRNVTGFPVKEKSNFIIGALNRSDFNLEYLNNADNKNYMIDEFFDSIIDEEWYFRINQKWLNKSEIGNREGLLCWNRDRYEYDNYISWNSRMIPFVARADFVRKITHREIARLKGIPEEYILNIQNKGHMYQRLMDISNVCLIQQIASSLCLSNREQDYIGKKISKSMRFKEILLEYFKHKNIEDSVCFSLKNSLIDFHYVHNNEEYCFVFKLYNNSDVENRIIAVCKSIYENDSLRETTSILIVGNVIGNEFKSYVKKEFQISIWDVANILYLLEEVPQLRSEFVSLLSFNVTDIIPQKIEQELFTQKKDGVAKGDLQECLRTIKPGQEGAIDYEHLCADILKFLFSENVEFFDEQRKSNDGLYRFDFCGKVRSDNTSEFFDTVQRFFCTKYIIFEFKNYENAISQKEIYTTEKYLYEKALRKVAIIVSRRGMDDNARKASRGSLREAGKLILCLSDEDVNKLIDMKDNDENPTDYLQVLLDNMLMDLEK